MDWHTVFIGYLTERTKALSRWDVDLQIHLNPYLQKLIDPHSKMLICKQEHVTPKYASDITIMLSWLFQEIAGRGQALKKENEFPFCKGNLHFVKEISLCAQKRRITLHKRLINGESTTPICTTNLMVFCYNSLGSVQFSHSVMSDSATPRIAARQASLSNINSQSLLKLMSIELVMLSSHLILCHPLLLLPPIPHSIRVFSNESTLHMR